jgi:hypothetical protein
MTRPFLRLQLKVIMKFTPLFLVLIISFGGAFAQPEKASAPDDLAVKEQLKIGK